MTFWLTVITLWATSLVMLPTSANGFWTPKAVLWVTGGLLIIASQWAGEPLKPSVKNIWMTGFFLWTSLLFAGITLWPRLWIPQTFARQIPVPWIVSTVLPTLSCWISFLVLDVLVRSASSDRWSYMGRQLCWIACVLAGYGLLQAFRLDPLNLGPRGRYGIAPTAMITTFGNPMLTANFLAIVAPLCLVFKPSHYRVSYGLLAFCLCVIQSTVSLVACLIGSSLIWGFRKQWKTMGLVWVLALAGLAWLWVHRQTGGFFSLSGRWQMWTTVLAFWKTNPLRACIGYGLGSAETLTANGLWTFGYFHCEPLQILFETGIVGFVLLCGWLTRLGKQVWRMPKTTLRMGWIASAVSFGIISLASFPLRIGSLLMVGVLIAAALETFLEEARHEQSVAA